MNTLLAHFGRVRKLPPVFKNECGICKYGPCMCQRVSISPCRHNMEGSCASCAIKPVKQKTFLEENNIRADVTDYNEYCQKQWALYCLPKGDLNKIDYDEWWRRTWNYGNITPRR